MLDIVGTVEATTIVEPSELALGESEAGPVTKTLTLENEGTSTITYALGHVPALATGPNTQTGQSYNITGTYNAPATVSFSAPNVTVPPGGTGSVSVTITADPTLPDRSIYGGHLTLAPQEGGPVYGVPYAGFRGDYQSTQVLTPTANGFPCMAQIVGPNYVKRPAGGTYISEEICRIKK